MTHRAAASVVVALVLLLVPGCAAFVPVPASDQRVECDPPAPPGATAAAVEYTEAAHRAHESRVVLSDTISAQDMMMSPDDMRTAVAGDEAFLAEVKLIAFPAEVAATADAFVRAVEADDAFLLAASAQDGYYGAHSAEREVLHERRTRAGVELRDALDLPPSGCSLNLP